MIAHRRNFTFAGEEPHKRRHHQHNWNVIRCQSLDQFLFFTFCIFRLANQRLNFSNRAFTGDRRHFNVQLTRQVGGSGVYRATFAGLNGNGFTCQTGLIHATLPGNHAPVHGKIFAGTHANFLSNANLVQRGFLFASILLNQARDIGGQLNKIADGALRAPSGAAKDQFAQPQEERKKARGQI